MLEHDELPLTTAPRPGLSIIVPTRQRVEPLRNMLASLRLTAAAPETIEVILAVDADDAPSIEFRQDGIALRHVTVPPGQSMGRLNVEGYRASRGEFVMLLNDDVIVRTPGWDEKVLRRLRRFPDGIVLVHINDTLLRDNLCTFPIVSRTFCELAGGICPEDYARYRIDDHIEDVFNLLGCLGHRRTIYLPDVIFEHQNSVARADGPPEYHAIPEVLALDVPRFLAHFPERKRLVLKLLEHIEGGLPPGRLQLAERTLGQLEDPFSLRIAGRQRVETDLAAAYRLARAAHRLAGDTFGLCRRGVACYRDKGLAGLLRAVRQRLFGSVQEETAAPDR